MKLTQQYAELNHLKDFKLTPMIKVINDLDVKSIEQVFKNEMHTWMCAVLIQYIFGYTKKDIENAVTSYIDEGNITFDKNFRKEVGFYNYLEVVLHEIHQLYGSERLDKSILQKAEKYEEFLIENQQRFWELDKLIRITNLGTAYKDYRSFAKTTIKTHFINLDKLNIALQKLFYSTDRNYLLRLLYPTNYEDYINNECQGFIGFNFDYYKSPPIYEADPKEKENYLRFLKAWFLEYLQNHKILFGWDMFPNEYNKLIIYANSLLPLTEKLLQSEIMQPIPTTKSVQVIDYPTTIFLNQQAYQLFKQLMEYFNKHATVSFVYRMMSEKEEPALIVVKDAPFRVWFNQQSFNLYLETYTKTYENSKNEDRIALYKMAKRLVYKES